MPLIDLWKSSPREFEEKSLKQVIAISGEGRLSDGSNCSREFRELLSFLPSGKLIEYCEHCLTDKFDDSGLALQDLINQAGTRLGFQTEFGRYRGVQNQVGYDGLWFDEDGHCLIVEVKTTDAYRINLNNLSEYRRKLVQQGKIKQELSSILIVVGRQDTGDLEAQVRGSRHSWDIRLISSDALMRLVKINEETDDPAVRTQIATILRPREYTRLDEVVDLVFAATEEVQSYSESEPITGSDERSEQDQLSANGEEAANFHAECISLVSRLLSKDLIKRSRSIYSSKSGDLLASCSVSKKYNSATHHGFWYAFHPSQQKALQEVKSSYVVLGGGSAKTVFLFPFLEFEKMLPLLNKTVRKDGRFYWHIHIHNYGGKYYLTPKKEHERIDLTKWLIEKA